MDLRSRNDENYRTTLYNPTLSWLNSKRSSVQIAATLRATWALLYPPMWPAAVDRTLLLDERSFSACHYCTQAPGKKLEANKNKNNCLVSHFYNKLKFPSLFSRRNRWEKSAGDINFSQKLLTRQLFLFLFHSKRYQKLFFKEGGLFFQSI